MKEFVVTTELKVPVEGDAYLSEDEGSVSIATTDYDWDRRYVITEFFELLNEVPPTVTPEVRLTLLPRSPVTGEWYLTGNNYISRAKGPSEEYVGRYYRAIEVSFK